MTCSRSYQGGRKRYARKSNRKSNRKQQKKRRNTKRRNTKRRKARRRNTRMRRMSGGSGLVDPLSSGLHEAATKLTSNPYVPSGAHIQPAGSPYQDDRNPYVI